MCLKNIFTYITSKLVLKAIITFLIAFAIIMLIITFVVYLVEKDKNKEKFEYEPETIDALCVFTGHKLDEQDYNFLKKWHKDMDIMVVHNVDDEIKPNEQSIINKIKNLDLRYIKRPNKGWDVTAWKNTILNNYEFLKNYDELILMNNSMNYEKINMKEICNHAKYYDIYGIYYQRNPRIKERDNHIQSYFTVFNKHVFNSQEFLDFYKNLPKIDTHQEAVNKYEMKLTTYFKDKGFNKIGTYICDTRPFNVTYAQPLWLKKLFGKGIIKSSPMIIKKGNLYNEEIYNEWKSN